MGICKDHVTQVSQSPWTTILLLDLLFDATVILLGTKVRLEALVAALVIIRVAKSLGMNFRLDDRVRFPLRAFEMVAIHEYFFYLLPFRVYVVIL